MKLMLVMNNGQYGPRYSTPCSNKKDDKEITYWMAVAFKRDRAPQFANGRNGYIDVKDAFFTSYETREGTKPKMFVLEWEMYESKQQDAPSMNIPDEDLPF